MGSAFAQEWTIPADVRRDACVLFALGWPDTVCHHAHEECPIEHPHSIDECGRFVERPLNERAQTHRV